MDPSQLNKAIAAIYASLDGPHLWPKALDAFREALGATGGTFVSTDADGRVKSVYCANPGASFEHPPAPMHGSRLRIPVVGANTAGIICGTLSLEQRMACDKFFEHARKLKLDPYLCASLKDSHDEIANVILYWNEQHGPVRPEELRAFERLHLHLKRAFRTLDLQQDLRSNLGAAWSIFDQTPYGLIMLNASLRIVHLNRSAREIVNTEKCLSIVGARLRASNRRDDERLQSTLTKLLSNGSAPGNPPHYASTVIKLSTERFPVILRATPLEHNGREINHKAQRVAVFLRNPSHTRDPDIEGLATAFALTNSETRLVAALASGIRVVDYAKSTGISAETARWHLKNIYVKTACDSQLSLVKLVYGSELAIKSLRTTTIGGSQADQLMQTSESSNS